MGTIDLPLILHNLASVMHGGHVIYAAIKLVFALMLGVAVHEVAKPKEVKLAL